MAKAMMTDEEIIDLYWKREEKAIAETDSKYGRLLLGAAMNILADRCDSEECQNDTYLHTWNSIPPVRPLAFHVFLTKIIFLYRINGSKCVETSIFATSVNSR